MIYYLEKKGNSCTTKHKEFKEMLAIVRSLERQKIVALCPMYLIFFNHMEVIHTNFKVLFLFFFI